MQALAVWRPRIYLIEAGKSFTLVCEYLRAHGLSVHSVTMAPGAEVSLPPFAGALSLLDPTADLATVAAEIDDEDEVDRRGPAAETLTTNVICWARWRLPRAP